MRHITSFILLLLIISCNENSEKKSNSEKDTTASEKIQSTTASTGIDSITLQRKNDSLVLNLADTILSLLKTKSFAQLSAFIHSSHGVRFSPYGSVDTTHDKILSVQQLNELSKKQKKILWGIYDGTGEPINLTIDIYFKKFVYDVDFLNAEKKSVNKILSTDNALNNLRSIYPECDFTEFYFSGFNSKYQGMDWKSLILVFKKIDSKEYLVAVVHDQWRV
jgi:hypothetical protein